MNGHVCRSCGSIRLASFCDLGKQPFSNSFVRAEDLEKLEPFFPLHAYVCETCFLVQLAEFQSPAEIFSDYAYFSSMSDSWLRHAKAYTETMRTRFGLGRDSFVVEIASNDGYLLQYFAEAGVPALGVEPAANVAAVALAKGLDTRVAFFGEDFSRKLAAERGRADLVLGNNVLAHVPKLNDFVAGVAALLAPQGVATFEFPHLERLIAENQFDTIYHEHFCYFSLHAVEQVFSRNGLALFDVDELATHGGSLRVYLQLAATARHTPSRSVARLRERERSSGLTRLDTYARFGERVREAKCSILEFLIGAKRSGETVAAYGAAAKGNTLLNYCGVRQDFIDYVVDRNPYKQGYFLPGTNIPVVAPDRLHETRPDYVFILPWNLKAEIIEQCAFVRAWGGRFVVPIPEITVLS